jgi:hypothetical protein
MSRQITNSLEFDQGDNINKFSDFFDFKEVIGVGSFGVCVHAVQIADMQEYAVKVIKIIQE